MTRQTGGARRNATAARNRAAHFAQLAQEANQSIRERTHTLIGWLGAEIAAAPTHEQEQALTRLTAMCHAMNANRQPGGRDSSDSE